MRSLFCSTALSLLACVSIPQIAWGQRGGGCNGGQSSSPQNYASSSLYMSPYGSTQSFMNPYSAQQQYLSGYNNTSSFMPTQYQQQAYMMQNLAMQNSIRQQQAIMQAQMEADRAYMAEQALARETSKRLAETLRSRDELARAKRAEKYASKKY